MVELGSSRGPRRPGLRGLSVAVGGVRRRSAPPTLLAKVQERWLGAVGASVSEQATPTSEREGVVTVSCRSAVWSSELMMLSTTLLEQLNEALPADAQVRGFRFVTAPK
jgi:predicted nucleic acid-binding Zn ribbon protein